MEILAVSPLDIDCVRLRQILSESNWRPHEVSSCGEASVLLDDRDFPVVLCERCPTDGNWKDLLEVTAILRVPPSLVVFSRLADEALWAEALNPGGFDVVWMPFEPEKALRATFAALRKWCEVSLKGPQEKRRLGGRMNLPEEAVRRQGRRPGSRGGSAPVMAQRKLDG